MIGEDRYNMNFRPFTPGWLQWVQFLGVMGAACGVYYLCEYVRIFVGTIPKQYPGGKSALYI